jgi:ceramide glucosyltransferase
MSLPSFGELCAACALLGCAYLLLTIGVTLFWRRRQRLPAPRAEAVTVLRPLHGSEPRLADCVSSFLIQSYEGPIQLVMGIQDPCDAALPVAQAIEARFPAASVIAIENAEHGTNAKISNLINMERAAAHEILIAADSDILARPDHIGQTVALLQKPGVGAVSVLYHGEAAAGFWSSLSAASINTHFLPNVLVALALHLAKPCFGSTIALRRTTLGAIGGFQAFANQLADDYAIGEAVRAAGFTVEIGLFSAAHICSEESARDLLSHQLRWARTIRSIDPAGHVGSFIANPFAVACVGIAAGNGSCFGIAAIALGLRLALCQAIERRFKLGAQDFWFLPLTDCLAFAVYLSSFFGTAVTWKRSEYSILSNGTLARNRRG